MNKRTTSIGHRTQMALEENAPRYLVEIALDGLTLRFVQDNADLTFPTSGGNTYYSWGFEFDHIPSTLKGEVGSLSIRFDNVCDGAYAGGTANFYRDWVSQYRFQRRKVSVKRVYTAELDSADDAMILFVGYMQTPRIDESEVVITATSSLGRLTKEFPPRRFSNTCYKTFDSADCLAGKTYTSDTIAFVSSGGDNYMTDTANGFLSVGFAALMTITISGSANNDKTALALIVNAGSLYIFGDTFANESAGATVTLTSSLAFEQTGTAEAGSSETEIIDTLNRSEADNFWRYGSITMTSGLNAGITRPIASYTESTGSIVPTRGFPYEIGIGDTYVILRGSDKTSKGCRNLQNFINFGGFPVQPVATEVLS